jgi:hypothetical protein
VPADRRGRFFGVTRLIYQSVGIVFTFIVGLTLGKDSSIGIFQFYLVVCFSFRIIGIVIYSRIPELERQFSSGRTILSSIFHVVGKKGYLPFSLSGIFSSMGLIQEFPLLMGGFLKVHMAICP